MKKRLMHCSVCGISGIVLLFLLVACDAGKQSAEADSGARRIVQMRNYSGDGYTVNYPTDWSTHRNGNVVVFTDSGGMKTFIVEYISNANGSLSATAAVN